MILERTLKTVLIVVGLLFTAMVYPLMLFMKQEPALSMMMSLYVSLGIFLIMAARNPSANRSLAFTAWSSFVHAILAPHCGYHGDGREMSASHPAKRKFALSQIVPIPE
jgi:hypothetical protein